jgi:hypothetical protein
MTVQVSGPLPRALVVAALSKSEPDNRRSRRWMRRRGLRTLAAPEPVSSGQVRIDAMSDGADADFVQCHRPGCCALRPLVGDGECAVCGRR